MERPLFVFVGGMLWATVLHAAESTADTPPSPLPTVPAVNLESLEQPHAYLSAQFLQLVKEIDRFFGDDRNYQESNDSVLQLDLSRATGYGGDGQYRLAGRAKLHLPNTERQLHLTLESDPDQNPAGGQPAAVTGVLQSLGAALRNERGSEGRWHFSTDAGLKFQGVSTTPFVRARASVEGNPDRWHLKGTETLFWFNTLGWGETTQFDVERLISEPVLFRATTSATWLHARQNFDLRQDFSFYQTWDDRTALLYRVSIIGVSQPVAHVTDHVLLFSYRYRLHQDWLFFEADPQLHFPEDDRYGATPALLVKLEMLFAQ
ncbi:MAG: hypothetical protein Fur0040_12420 [Sideroxydans sp.]